MALLAEGWVADMQVVRVSQVGVLSLLLCIAGLRIN